MSTVTTRSGNMLKIFLLTLLALAPSARAANEGVSGGQFLRIGVDAKSASLGETGAAADGARAVFANPAGLAGVSNSEAYFSFVQWVGQSGYSNLAFAKKAGAGAYGLAASYLSSPKIDKYDKFGNDLGDTYTASDMALTFGYGAALSGNTSLGGSAKYIASKLDTESASAVALDAGLKWAAVPGKLAFGAALQNLGNKMKYIGESDALPLNLKLGGQYTVNMAEDRRQRKETAFFADINFARDSGACLNAGVDFLTAYDKDSAFSMRAGYKTAARGSASGLSAGLGLDAATYSVDYAYAPMGDLGAAHRFSLTVKFGRQKRR